MMTDHKTKGTAIICDLLDLLRKVSLHSAYGHAEDKDMVHMSYFFDYVYFTYVDVNYYRRVAFIFVSVKQWTMSLG